MRGQDTVETGPRVVGVNGVLRPARLYFLFEHAIVLGIVRVIPMDSEFIVTRLGLRPLLRKSAAAAAEGSDGPIPGPRVGVLTG